MLFRSIGGADTSHVEQSPAAGEASEKKGSAEQSEAGSYKKFALLPYHFDKSKW